MMMKQRLISSNDNVTEESNGKMKKDGDNVEQLDDNKKMSEEIVQL